jgi:uncharacterized protein (TIGR02246 family)
MLGTTSTGEINMHHFLRNALLALTLAIGMSHSVIAAEGKTQTNVAAANKAWNRALNAGNAKALSALYAEDATLSAGDGKTLVGRAAIEKLFQGFVSNGVHNHTLEVINVGGSGNTIYQVAKWNANGAKTDGNVPTFGGITMSVMEKNADGHWLISSHVWNAAP